MLNGDILTGVDFRDMLAFHRTHGADATVAVRRYEVPVPYGVVECEAGLVREVREKPILHLLINAGMYLLEPAVREYIPAGQCFPHAAVVAAAAAGSPAGGQLPGPGVLGRYRSAA